MDRVNKGCYPVLILQLQGMSQFESIGVHETVIAFSQESVLLSGALIKDRNSVLLSTQHKVQPMKGPRLN